jgi:hypothetical protein
MEEAEERLGQVYAARQRMRILLVALRGLMISGLAMIMMMHGVFADGPGMEHGFPVDRD